MIIDLEVQTALKGNSRSFALIIVNIALTDSYANKDKQRINYYKSLQDKLCKK